MKKERKRYLCPKNRGICKQIKSKNAFFLATSFGDINFLCIFALIIKELIWKH